MALPLAVEAALAPDEVRRAPTGPGLLDENYWRDPARGQTVQRSTCVDACPGQP